MGALVASKKAIEESDIETVDLGPIVKPLRMLRKSLMEQLRLEDDSLHA